LLLAALVVVLLAAALVDTVNSPLKHLLLAQRLL
jgi:hypothetical protein